jgi:peptidoglycan/xylan/chitin deacetylase (PgdA/CDA1 family)
VFNVLLVSLLSALTARLRRHPGTIGWSRPPAGTSNRRSQLAPRVPAAVLTTAVSILASLALMTTLAPTAANDSQTESPRVGRWLAVSRAGAHEPGLPGTGTGGSRADGRSGVPSSDPGRIRARTATLDAQRGEATPPQPRPVLRPSNRFYARTGSRAVALTFDDGPDPRWTPRILAELRKYHIKATFCLIGSEVRAHPNLVRKIVADGHALCNHSLHHDLRLRKRSRAAVLADLRATNAAITKASGGVAPKYFRAPGGNWSPMVISVARQLGMASLHWAVDPQDWRRPPTGTIVARVRGAVRPGSVVLMHDGGGDRSHSVAAVRALLPGLKKKYRLIRL